MIVNHDTKKYSVVFQEDRLLDELSVCTNIMLPTPGLTKEVILEAMDEVDLTCSCNKKVCELSGGMKRRIALLRALLATYDVLILDEPFKGLDKDLKYKVISYIKKMTAHKTVILITHELEDISLFYLTNIVFTKLADA